MAVSAIEEIIADIKAGKMVRVNRPDTYAHNDPNSAFPDNEFVDKLVPFLGKIARG